MLNQPSRHEDVWESEGIASSIFNLGTTRTSVVSFKLRPLYQKTAEMYRMITNDGYRGLFLWG